MGALARGAFAVVLVAGCASEDAPATLAIDGRAYTLARAIAVDPGVAAVLNVIGDPCGVFRGEASESPVDGEAPLLLGAFAEGPTAVLAIDDEDPRTYVTVGTATDAVIMDGGTLDVRLSFGAVVRIVRDGLDHDIEVTPLDDPIEIAATFATTTCD
jgi:hypothetical protein